MPSRQNLSWDTEEPNNRAHKFIKKNANGMYISQVENVHFWGYIFTKTDMYLPQIIKSKKFTGHSFLLEPNKIRK